MKIVFNRLLGGWFVVRGPSQFPLAGPFPTKAAAKAWAPAQQAMRDARAPKLSASAYLNRYGNLKGFQP